MRLSLSLYIYCVLFASVFTILFFFYFVLFVNKCSPILYLKRFTHFYLLPFFFKFLKRFQSPSPFHQPFMSHFTRFIDPSTMFIHRYFFLFFFSSRSSAGIHVHVSNPHPERVDWSYACNDVWNRRESRPLCGHLFHMLPFICHVGEYSSGIKGRRPKRSQGHKCERSKRSCQGLPLCGWL